MVKLTRPPSPPALPGTCYGRAIPRPKPAAPAKPAPYVFDIQLDNGTHTVQVDTKAQYGWFENNTSGSGGGLWFKDNALTDYDGVAVLPMKVIRQLRGACFTVSEDFE